MYKPLVALAAFSACTLHAVAGPRIFTPPTPARIIAESTEVLADLEKIPLKGIPPKLLEDARAVAIIPRTIKAGFVVGGRGGHGLVLTKNDRGEWGDPTFISLGGASVGFQAGVSSTDVVLVFRKSETLQNLLAGNRKLTLGADAAIAAGPIGRQAAAGTDARLQSEIFSYSRSRGVFAGVSFDGAVLSHDRDLNAMFQADQRAETMQALANLKNKLVEISRETVDAPRP